MIKERLGKLREVMKQEGVQCLVIPTSDYHNSEYVSDYFMARRYFSGFTGSAGTLVVAEDQAALFTDGRYFIQAARELSGSDITLMKMGEPGVPEVKDYIKEILKSFSDEYDIAVVAVPLDSISEDTKKAISVATLGDSTELKVGEPAIAIGNAHGDYPFPPKLDLQRLDEINAVTDVPLVLHGGSGIPEDQLAEAFSRGINKFNYGTDTMHCYNDAVLAYHKACEPAGSNDMIGEAEYVQKEITDFLAKKLDLVKL